MQSIDAPLQVVVLVFEALGGVVAGQQGLALVARLTSSRTLAEEREAGIAELVASGKVTAVIRGNFGHTSWVLQRRGIAH